MSKEMIRWDTGLIRRKGSVLVVADGAALTEPGADESRQPRTSRLPLSGSSLKRVNLVLHDFKTLDEFGVHLLRGELGRWLTRRQLGLPCCGRFPVGLIDSQTGSLEGLPFLAVWVRLGDRSPGHHLDRSRRSRAS